MSEEQNDKSFNEDELKDIMDEIESLEEDCGEIIEEDESNQELDAAESEESGEHLNESSDDAELDSSSINEVDEVLDDVVNDFDDDDEDIDADLSDNEAAEAVNENVVNMKKPALGAGQHGKPVKSPSGSSVSLNAIGNMGVVLDFEFNKSASKIQIDQGAVKISLPGVEVVFDEKDGCKIKAENGMSFQLPLEIKKAG